MFSTQGVVRGLLCEEDMSKKFPQFSDHDEARPEVAAKPKRGAVRSGGRTAAALKKEGERKPVQGDVLVAPVAEAQVERADGNKRIDELVEPEWTESVPESVGGVVPESEGGNKRKRRRRKGKGVGAAASAVEVFADGTVATPSGPVPQPAGKQRGDPAALTKAAWKIYLAEISEEGVSLVGDQDARELARRCFRLAEIFLDESGRRGGGL